MSTKKVQIGTKPTNKAVESHVQLGLYQYAVDHGALAEQIHALSARAEVLRDPLLAARFWKKTDDVWWPSGPEDRHVRVLKLEPHRAELWDGPASNEVARHEFAKARATGERPNLGENRKVTVDLR